VAGRRLVSRFIGDRIDRSRWLPLELGSLLCVVLAATLFTLLCHWLTAIFVAYLIHFFLQPWRWISGQDLSHESGNESRFTEHATLLGFLSVQGAALIKFAEGGDVQWKPIALYAIVAVSTLGAMVGIQRATVGESDMSVNTLSTHRFGKWSIAWGMVTVASFVYFACMNWLPNQEDIKPSLLQLAATGQYKWEADRKPGFYAEAKLEPGAPWSFVPANVDLHVVLLKPASEHWDVWRVALFRQNDPDQIDLIHQVAYNPPAPKDEKAASIEQVALFGLENDGKYLLRFYFHPRPDVELNIDEARMRVKDKGELRVIARHPSQSK